MRFAILLAVLVVIALPAGAQTAFPDQSMSPGALNPAVTQDTINTTICVHGWTKTIRPSVSYTNELKRRQIAALHYPDQRLDIYQEDHVEPLGVGGHPTDEHNLWPQPLFGVDGWTAAMKDRLEKLINRLVCLRVISLEDGQAVFLGDWRIAYVRHFGNPAKHSQNDPPHRDRR